MASTQDDVVVRLRLKDVAKFIADVKSGRLAIDDLEKKIQSAGRAAARESSTGGGFSKLTSFLGGMKWYAMGAVGALASAAGGIATFAVKSASDLQQVEISFATLLGSADKAKTTLAQLQDFAIATPFQLPAIEEASKLFLAYKFNLASLLPTLQAVGDASAGLSLGDEGLTGIMNVLGQMKAATVVHGQDILQLTSRGIMAKDYLEQAFHLTPQQFDKAEQAGKISAAAAIPVILRGMEQQFKGQMANQAKSLAGVASNFPDAIRKALTKVVNPYIPAMTGWLQRAVDLVGSKEFQDGLSNAINSTIAGVKIGIEFGKTVVASIQDAIKTGDWSGIGGAIGTQLRNLLTGGGSAAGGVDWYTIGKNVAGGAISFAIGFLSALLDPTVWWPIIRDHWLEIVGILLFLFPAGKLLGVFGKILTKIPLLGKVGEWLVKLGDGLAKAGGPIWGLISSIGKGIGNAFVKVFPEMGTRIWYFFTRIKEIFTDGIPGIGRAIGKWFADLPEKLFTWMFTAIKRMGDAVKTGAEDLFKPIVEKFQGVITWATTQWEKFLGLLGSIPGVGGLVGGGDTPPGPGYAPPAVNQDGTASGVSTVPGHGMGPVPGHAAGGIVTRAHMAWVGERGPELLTLPRGSSVIPLPRIPEFATGTRPPIHVHLEVDGRELTTVVLDDLNARAARR